MSKKKTVTLKLSKEDHDLLVPNLDVTLKAVKELERLKKEEEDKKKRAEESESDTKLKVVKKIKVRDETIEIKDGDPTRVWRNLHKMKTLGQAITYIDEDNFNARDFDFMALAWIFEDLYEETNEILLKYGLSSF